MGFTANRLAKIWTWTARRFHVKNQSDQKQRMSKSANQHILRKNSVWDSQMLRTLGLGGRSSAAWMLGPARC